MPVILIVDDEPDIVEVLEMVLRDEGMEVLTSASGREALATLQKRSGYRYLRYQDARPVRS
jgi:CheY-like chemotaxis protein